MNKRIGVYICHCGGNISDYVDVEELGKMFNAEDGVVISKDVMFACADSNQKAMIQDIRELHLDGIVVASCSPKLHLHTFRNVAARGGLNPTNYTQVNIREQCSWPHSDKPREATVKAAGLIRAGIRKVVHSESLDNIEITVKKSVLVVGAGVAGMKAAIDLSRAGNDVYLVEKDYFVGGHVAQNEKVFMTGQNGKEIVSRLYAEMRTHSNITLFTGAIVERVTGSLGNFQVDIKVRPRYIQSRADRQAINKAMEECQVRIPDAFGCGISNRKAIYKNYPGALPDVPVVDIEAIQKDPGFVSGYSMVMNLNEQPETMTLTTGAVLVTTGFDFYQPKTGEYGYGDIPSVLTLPEFNRLVEMSPDRLIYRDKPITKVAFIYCVGNRQTKGENKYCSRQCCSSAIYTSLQLKEKYKDIKSFHLFRDIRTYGKQEVLYEKSSIQGDIYLRFEEKEPPVVEPAGKNIRVKVKDYLTGRQELELEADLVVLVTGMVPREDFMNISEHFKIPIGSDKFFNEIHPKLKPVETVIKGVYIGGSCQGPRNISESVQSSGSAAAKISALLKSGKVSIDPVIARVNNDACKWCGKCSEVCDYTAIREIESGGRHIASVTTAICSGCGICAPVCPVNAIEIAQYTDTEIESMIDGFMEQVAMQETVTVSEKAEETKHTAMKEYPEEWNHIIRAMGVNEKSIPQLAEELALNRDSVTFHVMTMNKYNILAPSGMDDNEQYYYYKINNK
jgi:heterodisulfide reductase subunit A2